MRNFPLHPGLKGFPTLHPDVPVEAVAQQGWHVLGSALPTPLATLRQSALMHNMAWMQAWADRKGVALAPHGKTTLSTQLMRDQLQAGAWGLTFANVHQLQWGLEAGAQRFIIANQVLADADLYSLDIMLTQRPDIEVFFLVDSLAQWRAIEVWSQRSACTRVWQVLVEMGTDGFRTGCRNTAQALALAQAIADSRVGSLAGVECYEGGLANVQADPSPEAVTALVRRVHGTVQAIDQARLWGREQVLLSAGGSAIFDLILPVIQGLTLSRPVLGVLRSGCYVTHDHGHYARYLTRVLEREGLTEGLQPALQVWAMVQSVPEPGLAILNAGRRDVSFDQQMPVPLLWAGAGELQAKAAPTGWQVQALSDQHAHMRVPVDGPQPAVGDKVALGISHPCTTFDKWAWMAVVDDEGAVTGAITTGF